MRFVRFEILLLVVSALGACGGGPEIIGGGETTVSITAGPLANVSGMAERYCQGYGKRAVAKGHRRSSGTTLTNVFIYDCKQDNR